MAAETTVAVFVAVQQAARHHVMSATVRRRRMIAAQGVSAPIGFVTGWSAVPIVRTALVSRGASCRGS